MFVKAKKWPILSKQYGVCILSKPFSSSFCVHLNPDVKFVGPTFASLLIAVVAIVVVVATRQRQLTRLAALSNRWGFFGLIQGNKNSMWASRVWIRLPYYCNNKSILLLGRHHRSVPTFWTVLTLQRLQRLHWCQRNKSVRCLTFKTEAVAWACNTLVAAKKRKGKVQLTHD